MMVFFDTNLLIYAFCKNVDDINQQNISVKLFEKAIIENNLLLSEISLCEFAFISNKLQENEETINQNLKFLASFVRENSDLSQRIIEIISKTHLYKSSFDIYHLAFCENNNCKLITFDKGFKKFETISKIKIDIL